ncbi:isoniazid inducible gene protein IniC [Actinoplanes siamensis]|uniref:Isoniazid inducible gene protein IniC n=1 Tax=Actinoplanes siamensis TaxID=1223317 RepID=A0A919KBL2_9ACTN|nr:dynamin family protein [Actinoplanes siamensis]GIF02521.1 isoniazid inducible gene protein IniC [Actinoplanes siamensis]
MTGPLSDRLATLCHEIVTEFGSGAGGQLRQIGNRLHEPLRVAIAGRLKAGKSTLVNALIGRRVAPTAAGECTRVVTRFRYGPADRVDIVTRDGDRRSLPLDDDGMVPARLGVPASRIAYLDVTLTNDRLRTLTVVDTPGLSSTDTASSERAEHVVGDAPFDADIDADSAREVATAEAVVYVFTQAVRADDLRALDAFHDASARLAASPINALGVLAKADTLAGGAADPWPVAGPLARQQAALLARTVGDVVPVSALLAETAGAGRLTDADRDALAQLATLAPADRELLLTSVDLFRTLPAPLGPDHRERLLHRLDLYGIGFACAQLAAEPRLGTGELARRVLAASGFPRLRQTLQQSFGWRSDAIKAGWALTRLERIAGHTGDVRLRAAVRDALEDVLRDPAYHRLRLLDAAQRAATGAVRLPADRETELIRLATSDDPRWILNLPDATAAELSSAAIAAAGRWRAYAVDGAGPAQARVAHIAHRGFQILAQEVRARCAT